MVNDPAKEDERDKLRSMPDGFFLAFGASQIVNCLLRPVIVRGRGTPSLLRFQSLDTFAPVCKEMSC